MNTIAFPGLGLEFNINPAAFSIFGKEVYWYGIIISFAFFLAIILARHDAAKFGINPDDIIDFALLAIPTAIIGARLYYVMFKWEDYKNNLFDIIAVWKGGLAIYGAILASIAAAYFFARRKKIPVFKFFDFCSPYLVLGQAIGRWGNFINREAYGTQTMLPWRMEIIGHDYISKISVHPTFLYESLWDFGIFAFLIWYRKKTKISGEIFFLYMILYGTGRFWIEGLRADSLMLGNFRVSQLIAGIFAVSLTIVLILIRKHVLCRDEKEKNGKHCICKTQEIKK